MNDGYSRAWTSAPCMGGFCSTWKALPCSIENFTKTEKVWGVIIIWRAVSVLMTNVSMVCALPYRTYIDYEITSLFHWLADWHSLIHTTVPVIINKLIYYDNKLLYRMHQLSSSFVSLPTITPSFHFFYHSFFSSYELIKSYCPSLVSAFSFQSLALLRTRTVRIDKIWL